MSGAAQVERAHIKGIEDKNGPDSRRQPYPLCKYKEQPIEQIDENN